jgi:hypothetical protein
MKANTILLQIQDAPKFKMHPVFESGFGGGGGLKRCIFLEFNTHLNFQQEKCVKCKSYIQSNMVYGRTVEWTCSVQVNVEKDPYMGPLSLVLSRETTFRHNR